MTVEQLLDNPVSQHDYRRGKASALPPDELHPGELYNARLLLSEVARPEAEVGIYAVDALVQLGYVSEDESHLFAVIRYLSEDGQPEDPVYTPRLNGAGIMQGNAAPLRTAEGYLLNSTGSLEDELQELERRMLVPVRVRVIGATAIPIEQALPLQ